MTTQTDPHSIQTTYKATPETQMTNPSAIVFAIVLGLTIALIALLGTVAIHNLLVFLTS